MKKRKILTLAAVICCLFTFSLTAHAAFKYVAQTEAFSIKIAEFTVNTAVQFTEAGVTASTPVLAALALDTASEEQEVQEDTEIPGEPGILGENGSYMFPAPGTAAFTLVPTGTAAEGYCTVTVEDVGTYYTGQIAKGSTHTFSVTAGEGTVVKIEAVWGKYNAENEANAEIKPIENGVIVLVPAEDSNGPEATASPETTPSPAPEATASPTPEATASPEATVSPTPEATASPEVTASPAPEATASPAPNLTA